MLIGRPHPRLSCAVIDSPNSQIKIKNSQLFMAHFLKDISGKLMYFFASNFVPMSAGPRRERDEKEELCRMRRGVELGWIQGHSLLYNNTMKAPSTQGHYNTLARGVGTII